MTSNNTYIDKIIELSNDSPQTAEYILIVSNARIRASTKKESKIILGYTEEHHILPRSFKMGGETDKLNYAYLSAREHYRCHQLLIEMGLKRNLHAKMIQAFGLLCTDGKHKFITEEEYQELNILLSIHHHMKNPELREQYFKKTGYYTPSQNPECKEKKKRTNFKKTGFISNLANPELREQYSQNYLEETGYTHNMKNPECKEMMKHNLEIKFTRPLVLQIQQDIEKYNVIDPRKIMGINSTDWRQADNGKLYEGSIKFYKHLDERKIKIKEYECRINEINSAFKSIDDKQSLISCILEIKDFYNIKNHTVIMGTRRNWKRLNVIELKIALEKILQHTVDKFYIN
jgi:hypothetical protein